MEISSSIPLLEEVTPFWITTLTSWILWLKSFVPVKQKTSNMMVILFDKSSSTSVCKPYVSAVHQHVKPATQVQTLLINSRLIQTQVWLNWATQPHPALNKEKERGVGGEMKSTTVNIQEWILGTKFYTKVVPMLATAEVLEVTSRAIVINTTAIYYL